MPKTLTARELVWAAELAEKLFPRLSSELFDPESDTAFRDPERADIDSALVATFDPERNGSGSVTAWLVEAWLNFMRLAARRSEVMTELEKRHQRVRDQVDKEFAGGIHRGLLGDEEDQDTEDVSDE